MPFFHRFRSAALIATLLLGSSLHTRAEIPTPEAHLGFQPGADFQLATWEQVITYFEKLGDLSDRVAIENLGESTEGRPFLVAIVSSPETIANLDHYKDLQRRLADPTYKPDESDPEALIAESKATVLVTCTIHSSETASTLMSLELLHDLATKDDPGTLEILDKTILLLFPSVNPDGVDIVHDWYERSKGHPWEGSGMPWLYHKYAGHDTNRDWFMLNLKETQHVTRFLYKEWFPTITWDVHQMGSTGPRLFVPPFHDPVNPNLDPRINQGIFIIGAHLAADLAAAGKKGVATNAMYDNWWNGGNRTVPQRHNMVGILTEAASVKLASPIFLNQSDLRGGSRGFRNHDLAVNFVAPWPGGWWRLRDIVDYELICAESLLTLAARYKDWFQTNYREMALTAIETGETEPPFAWVVPSDQRDPGTAAELVRILHDTGIVVQQAVSPFEISGVSYPEGTWILPASQPYRPYLKDIMERQEYPNRVGADGTPERPYDVAGWTLPLQMGVKYATIDEPFDVEVEVVERVEKPNGGINVFDDPQSFLIKNQANDDFRVLNALHNAGVEVFVRTRGRVIEGEVYPSGTLAVAADESSRSILESALEGTSTQVIGVSLPLDPESDEALVPLRPQRIGLFQPWVPSMDEGWTRLVLENFQFEYQTLHNADIRAGDLNERIDVLVFPSIVGRTIRNGYGSDQSEPKYVGGIGQEGIDAIRSFVQGGGTLVCLENSCPFAIDILELPVEDVIGGLRTSDFYGPGSILRVEYESENPLTLGTPTTGSLYFSRSLGFDAGNAPDINIAARYGSTELLQSGWLLGEEHLQGKAAVVEAKVGDGRAVLFAFPPQHRGQPHGTFRIFFNALMRGGVDWPEVGVPM